VHGVRERSRWCSLAVSGDASGGRARRANHFCTASCDVFAVHSLFVLFCCAQPAIAAVDISYSQRYSRRWLDCARLSACAVGERFAANAASSNFLCFCGVGGYFCFSVGSLALFVRCCVHGARPCYLGVVLFCLCSCTTQRSSFVSRFVFGFLFCLYCIFFFCSPVCIVCGFIFFVFVSFFIFLHFVGHVFCVVVLCV